MARSERQEGGTHGGVGTMTRTGTRSRPQQAPDAEQAESARRRGRGARPVPAQRPESDQQVLQGQRADAGQRAEPGQRAGGRRGPSSQRAGARAGGPRQGAPQAVAAPASPGSRPRIGAPWRVPSTGRPEGSQPVRTTGPQPAVPPGTAAQTAQAAATAQAPEQFRLRRAADAEVAGAHRMPFVLLLCGLLGGALVSALVISTTLAEGSFQITKLQDSTSSLARQQQTLEEEVAQAKSAQVIEQRASQLGMRRPGELLFVDLKTGKTSNDGPTWVGAVNAPGYAP
jgi:hypothetical protein